MKTKPYVKNQLYKGNYQMSKEGEIKLPDKCYWKVGKYIGGRSWSYDVTESGEITLLLEEEYGQGSGFWSVISFLTLDEAKELAERLIDMATNTVKVDMNI